MISTTSEYIAEFFEKHNRLKTGKVLDVGSLDISGNPKQMFIDKGYEYIGLDMRSGKNVDIVADAHRLPFKKNTFSLVFCVDTIEHDDAFWLTIAEMKRVLKRGGWLIIGAPSRAHNEHKHPYDYWRFMKESFELVLLKGFKNINVKVCYNSNGDYLGHPVENQIYGWGQKA